MSLVRKGGGSGGGVQINDSAPSLTQVFSSQKTVNVMSESKLAKTHPFVSEGTVIVDYPTLPDGQQYRPAVILVEVLKTDQELTGLTATVTQSGVGTTYYQSVGMYHRTYDGKWGSAGEHNCFKAIDGSELYLVFDKGANSWIILETTVSHLFVGELTRGHVTRLYQSGSLPVSYGAYQITVYIDEIRSEDFVEADAEITHFADQKQFQVSFGSSKPSGIIIYN